MKCWRLTLSRRSPKIFKKALFKLPQHQSLIEPRATNLDVPLKRFVAKPQEVEPIGILERLASQVRLLLG